MRNYLPQDGVAQCGALVINVSVTGYYANLTRSIKLIHGQGTVYELYPVYRALSYALTVSQSASTCFCWNHKYFTWGGYTYVEAASHQASTISMPWWAIRAKQLSVALSSLFVGSLERWSLFATNRTLWHLAMVSVLLTHSGWCNIQWLLPIAYTCFPKDYVAPSKVFSVRIMLH